MYAHVTQQELDLLDLSTGAAGGEIEQIQFLLGHASVQTTERYIGCKQKLGQAVNDRIEFRLGTN